MINRFALSFLCIELDRNEICGVTLVYILLTCINYYDIIYNSILFVAGACSIVMCYHDNSSPPVCSAIHLVVGPLCIFVLKTNSVSHVYAAMF